MRSRMQQRTLLRVAFDRIADAEMAHREGTEGNSAATSPSYAVSDAVLDQRTYFVPTMVRICNLAR